jgi:hypothetical protein
MADGAVKSKSVTGGAAPAKTERRKQAVVVVHGMGEQRPMETLRALADTLADTRGVFIIPDQATGSAELARIRVAGIKDPLGNKDKDEPATDFYELYYADLLGGGTFAQLRGWVLGLMLRWPHQVPKEVWRVWAFLWVLVGFTFWWLGSLLGASPLDKLKSLFSGITDPNNKPSDPQLYLLIAACVLFSVWLSRLAYDHAHNSKTAPDKNRSLSLGWSYLVPLAVPAAIAIAGYHLLPWHTLNWPGQCGDTWRISVCADEFATNILHLEWVRLLAAALIWFVVAKFGVPYFGDVARYVGASPELIAGRQAIRERGLKLLEELHDRRAWKNGLEMRYSEYDRIIVIAHSLGSIVAYDVMRIFWAERNISNFQKVPDDAIEAMEEMADLPVYSQVLSDAQLNTLTGQQSRIAVTMRKEKDAWRISDFITMGSPLARADFLMSRDWPRFQKNIEERRFPTCPPVLERAPADSGKRDGFTFYSQKAGSDIPHHGAMFAVTRWLAIYDPIRKLIFGGDFIGGPVKQLFGHGVSQLAVKITRPGWFVPNVVTHTDYWRADAATSFEAGMSQLPSDLKTEVNQGQIVIKVLRKRIWQG